MLWLWRHDGVWIETWQKHIVVSRCCIDNGLSCGHDVHVVGLIEHHWIGSTGWHHVAVHHPRVKHACIIIGIDLVGHWHLLLLLLSQELL